MDDFGQRPVRRPAPRPQPKPQPQPQSRPQPTAKPLTNPVASQPKVEAASGLPPIKHQPLSMGTGLNSPLPKRSRKKVLFWWLGSFVTLILLTLGGVLFWYSSQLAPVDITDTAKTQTVIKSGSNPTMIAEQLKEDGLIRSTTAFLWHARFQGVQNKLQAGTYRLAKSESTPEIIDHLSSGKVDMFSVTFLPGATLADNKESLISAGYSEQEVVAALSKSYDSPLFAGRPSSADLEGYIYGETYSFSTDTSAEAVLEHVFEHFYGVIEKNGLVDGFKVRGLTLYEGITLASIIQREASPKADDMSEIAQVFYNRLEDKMPLG